MDESEATPGERVRTRYRAALAAEGLRPDPAQAALVERLAALGDALVGYAPRAARAGWLDRLRGRTDPPGPPSGLYIHGPVGRGKSLLMDLFFAALPIGTNRRVHFHAFMLEVHARLGEQRRRGGAAQEPLATLADGLIEQAWLLCFDELHVQNIADAMILVRLFEAVLERGMVIVATSNYPPERLYEGGLNRHRFLPFIELLHARLEVVGLGGATDHRLERLRDVATYHQPLGAATDARLEEAFAALTDAAAGASEVIEVGDGAGSLYRGRRGASPGRGPMSGARP